MTCLGVFSLQVSGVARDKGRLSNAFAVKGALKQSTHVISLLSTSWGRFKPCEGCSQRVGTYELFEDLAVVRERVSCRHKHHFSLVPEVELKHAVDEPVGRRLVSFFADHAERLGG